jgi:hypothetical protein
MASDELGQIVGQSDMRVIEGTWRLDGDDFLLYAMLCDPIFCAELLFEEPLNHTHGGCYTVYDYEYPLFRSPDGYAAFPCARSVGKTESIKAKSVSHAFKRMGEDLLLTAPELIHLEALTQHVEQRITDVRLTREFLKKDNQKSGFTHKPFMVEFTDGTRIIGRIPRLTGPQPLDAKLATPTGWTTMGEIEVGDRVLGSDGKPTKVLEIHEKGVRKVWRLELSDGTWVEATGDHRFKVRRDRSQPWQELTVDEIRRHTEKQAALPVGKQAYWLHVPDAVPIHYAPSRKKLPLDPYLLGVLLGDGVLPRLLLGAREARRRAAALAQTKHIPESYMRGSLDQRLALLQGLLDADGTCSKEGKVQITLDNRGLIEQLAEVGRSLGGWASVREHRLKPSWQVIRGERYYNRGGVYWQVTFDMGDMVPFRLAPKAERCVGRRRKARARAIKAVVPVRRTPTRCISVAANDHLYLSDFFIPVFNTGVKGMHEPDMIMDEAQDYPPKGYTEAHETVMKEHTDSTGKLDFTYHLYGVHSGAAGGRFESLAQSGEFKVTAVTALMKPGWNKAEKAAAAAMYGGTHSPDYRRNILGEPGTALSQFFVTARLMSCLDQDKDSHYNTIEFKDIHILAEDVDKMFPGGADFTGLLDLPPNLGPLVYGGMDVGLINDPTVITIFAIRKDKEKRERLKLVRMIHLWRFRERQIREAAYRIDLTYGKTLQAFGQDITGMGLPLLQAMEDDEKCPDHLREVGRGYTFNALVPVGVDRDYVSEIGGKMVDQYGNMVKIERDKWTGQDRYVSYMTMIEASTRYLRNMVDSGFLMLPFHQGLVKDMQGETEQRVRAMGMTHLRKKPNAFHMLDSMRAMAMAYMSGQVEENVLQPDHTPVLDLAVATEPGAGGGMPLR